MFHRFTSLLFILLFCHFSVLFSSCRILRDIFVSAGYPLLFDSPTNQQYPIMSDDELAILGKSFGYEYWERVDETHSGVRFCASWTTKQEHVDALRAAVNALKK